jgi:nicotinamidase/pyrazinamidase
MSKKSKLEFLIIDPQNDFCSPKGNLFVTGADKDSVLLAKTITRLKNRIDDIHVTLDTHHFVDIAHPIFWLDSKGQHPNPFTLISKQDVKDGKWRTTNPQFHKRAFEYVTSLEDNKRYLLCIWPPHCLIGTWGHNVVDPIMKSLVEWELDFSMVDYVTKGSNFWTEHYSAVQADVPDSQDPGTMLNTRLIQTLQEADVIALSGQALSHCVANTVRDIANNFGEDNIKKMTLLIDTSSSVPGFEKMGEDFLTEMQIRGMNISEADKFMV